MPELWRSMVWVRVSLELPRRASRVNREVVFGWGLEGNCEVWLVHLTTGWMLQCQQVKAKLVLQGSKQTLGAGRRWGRLECLPPEQSMQTLFSPDRGSRWLGRPSPNMVPPPPSVSLGPKECGTHSFSFSGCFSWPKAMLGLTSLWASWDPQGAKARSHGGAQGRRVNKCCYVLWTLHFSVYIFFPCMVSNTPITLFAIWMLTAFKSLSLAELSLLDHKLK